MADNPYEALDTAIGVLKATDASDAISYRNAAADVRSALYAVQSKILGTPDGVTATSDTLIREISADWFKLKLELTSLHADRLERLDTLDRNFTALRKLLEADEPSRKQKIALTEAERHMRNVPKTSA